jgi:hypothetical protein
VNHTLGDLVDREATRRGWGDQRLAFEVGVLPSQKVFNATPSSWSGPRRSGRLAPAAPAPGPTPKPDKETDMLLRLYLIFWAVELVGLLLMNNIPRKLKAEYGEITIVNVAGLIFVNAVNTAFSAAITFVIVQLVAHLLTGHFITGHFL